MEAEALVYVVDDDASLRASLQDLLESVGLRVAACASAQDFLRGPRPEGPSCLVLDVRLPGLSGLELQQRLTAGDLTLPIIFITGHGDISMSVQASPCGCLTSDTWTSYPGLEEEVDGKHHRPQEERCQNCRISINA